MRTDADYAAELDRHDLLARFRDRFYLPAGRLYFDGNSLGLLSRDAEAAVLRVLDEWKTLAIDGWLGAPTPWPDGRGGRHYRRPRRRRGAAAGAVGALP